MSDVYYNYCNLREYCNKMNILNVDGFLRWYKDIATTKISMFTYENLPQDLTTEIIEQALMYNNCLCFAYIKGLNRIMLCRYIYGSTFSYYWKPTKVTLLALNGEMLDTEVPFDELILVRDNISDIIPFLTTSQWIEKIQTCERTLDILLVLLRMPTIFTGDKNQTATLKQLFKKALDFEGFVIGDKSLKDSIEQFDINLPAQPEDVYQLMEHYKNYALNSIGIYSVNEKRERVVTSEIVAQNDFADNVYQDMLNERIRFVKECNEKFGTNIKLVESYKLQKQSEAEDTEREEMAKAKAEIQVEKAKQETTDKEDKENE